MDKKLNRRDFLRLGSVAAAGAALSACAPQIVTQVVEKTVEVEKVVKETQIVKETQVVKETVSAPVAEPGKPIVILSREQGLADVYMMPGMVQLWNQGSDSQVTLEYGTGLDIAAKAQAAQAAGDLAWDGFAVMEVPNALYEWTQRKLIQPIDDFIATSKVKGADKVLPGLVPVLKDSTTYQGKTWGVPGNWGSYLLAWGWDFVKAAGFEKGVQTWDEIYECSKKLKEKFPERTPFAFVFPGVSDIICMLWGAVDQPLDDKGLPKLQDPVVMDALKWLRKMVDEELTVVGGDQWGNWLKDGTCIIECFDVASTLYNKSYGTGKSTTATNILREKDKPHAGTLNWANALVVFDKCKNPQGATDFFLYMMGPENDIMGKNMATAAAKPCYQYTYDKFIKAEDPDTGWEIAAAQFAANSVAMPVNTLNSALGTFMGPAVQDLMDPSKKFEEGRAAEVMQKAYKDIETFVAKPIG